MGAADDTIKAFLYISGKGFIEKYYCFHGRGFTGAISPVYNYTRQVSECDGTDIVALNSRKWVFLVCLVDSAWIAKYTGGADEGNFKGRLDESHDKRFDMAGF